MSESLDQAAPDTGNLFGVIDIDNVFGLNLSVPEHAKHVIKPWDERESTEKYAESGVDDQLIIHVPFTQNVRIRSVMLKMARGEVCPHRLRIYANYPTGIDFDDAETTIPQHDMSLLESETGVTEYPLRVAAFVNVNSLTLFFSESPSTTLSRLYYIGFRGEARTPQKDTSTTLQLGAANAADASIIDRLAEKSAGRQSTIR
ncbi:hypothetical protein BOTBODRAFT_33676 [Botryobasidium botryosum FD-172 SS1]|uniref:PITH domain-containing protein n=1 Tax=Botryobasidium botryosum (strain FD-172 SS1) TaxID=930990 RepID=A0A067MFC2_BOTB1|nr:hypothetical protein BOTBODRAFT_33676 [Botryobasidium botryosum FD-172 SS1]